MTVSLLTKYEIPEAIELLKNTDDFTKRATVHSMADVKTKDRQQRRTWKRIFSFRKEMADREVSNWDSRAEKLLETYKKYHCTQGQAHILTGIPTSALNRITREVPAVQRAYQKAQNYRKNQARQARRRKRAKHDQV